MTDRPARCCAACSTPRSPRPTPAQACRATCRAAEGADRRRRRRQGLGCDGARLRGRTWPGRLGARRDALRTWRAAAGASRSSRRRTRCRTTPGEAAARRILDLVQGLGEDDLVAGLISGGGSALLPRPPEADARRQAGRQPRAAPIGRRDRRDELRPKAPLRAIKGGRLAAAAIRRASSTLRHLRRARRRSARHRVRPDRRRPDDVRRRAGDPRSATASTRRRRSLRAARKRRAAKRRSPATRDWRGARPVIIAAPQIVAAKAARGRRGSRRRAAHPRRRHRGRGARRRQASWPGSRGRSPRTASPFAAPCVLLSGGETTVTVRGQGRGGRNVEFLLALAIALDGQARIWAIAGDTDGVDGAEEIAGAVIGPDTLERAGALGLAPSARLADNDAHSLLRGAGRPGRHRPDAHQRQRLPRRARRRLSRSAAVRPHRVRCRGSARCA